MASEENPTAETWLTKAHDFYAKENWIGALSSVRNALRLQVNHLAAWHLGCEILLKDDRQHVARRYAKALKRFAAARGEQNEVRFADEVTAQVVEYFANYHRLRGETDLTHFAAKGDLEKVKELLESGVDPNERNSTTWTALHCVAMRDKEAMARLLIDHKADIEATESLQETPLITACRFGNAQIIPVLLTLGANVNHVAKENHTALWYAIQSMKDLATVKLLISAGADVNETYEYGDNPFLLSVSAQKAEVTNYLLPLITDVARTNKHEVCAIRFAAGYNDTQLIEKLLARGVDAEQATSYGHTPLMSAAEANAVEAARLLLAHGADPNRKNMYGESAISLAKSRESYEVYELLTGEQLDRRRD